MMNSRRGARQKGDDIVGYAVTVNSRPALPDYSGRLTAGPELAAKIGFREKLLAAWLARPGVVLVCPAADAPRWQRLGIAGRCGTMRRWRCAYRGRGVAGADCSTSCSDRSKLWTWPRHQVCRPPRRGVSVPRDSSRLLGAAVRGVRHGARVMVTTPVPMRRSATPRGASMSEISA